MKLLHNQPAQDDNAINANVTEDLQIANASLTAVMSELYDALQFIYNETSGSPRIHMMKLAHGMARVALASAKPLRAVL